MLYNYVDIDMDDNLVSWTLSALFVHRLLNDIVGPVLADMLHLPVRPLHRDVRSKSLISVTGPRSMNRLRHERASIRFVKSVSFRLLQFRTIAR